MDSSTALTSDAPTATERAKFLTVAANGTALFVLSYYFVWGLYQAAKYWISTHHFVLRGRWDPSHIYYSLADAEWVTQPTAIIGAYGIGPLVGLVVGIAAFVWFWKVERAKRGNIKLLLMWVALHSCNAVLGALLADTFTQSGSWYVSSWIFQMGNVVNVTLAVLAGLAQVAAGYFVSIAFLQSHDSHTVMLYQNRGKMVLATIVAPWVFGSFFIVLAKAPYITVYEILHLVVLALLLLPMVLGCMNEIFESTVRKPRATRLALGWLVLAALFAILWRLALSPPQQFG